MEKFELAYQAFLVDVHSNIWREFIQTHYLSSNRHLGPIARHLQDSLSTSNTKSGRVVLLKDTANAK
jgi:hypothetical protein